MQSQLRRVEVYAPPLRGHRTQKLPRRQQLEGRDVASISGVQGCSTPHSRKKLIVALATPSLTFAREQEMARDHRVTEKRQWSRCPAGFAPGQEQETDDGIGLPVIAGHPQSPGSYHTHSKPQGAPSAGFKVGKVNG